MMIINDDDNDDGDFVKNHILKICKSHVMKQDLFEYDTKQYIYTLIMIKTMHANIF